VKYANRITGGSVHPDTGDIIPFPMRLSGFVTFNGPILLLCLFTPNQTPVFNAFMQFVNQTYNAGLNYGNRNASSNYTTNDLLRGYGGAVTASIGIAYATRRLLAPQLAGLTGSKMILASAFLNYVAAAIPGAVNCSLMRQKELFDGIEVQDDTGKSHGKSQIAGKQAVY
jgi:sideroflexin-5